MVKLANKKSIVFSFLITYLLILFVPISIGFIIYAKSSQIIEEEINRANAAVLKQLQQNVDKRLDDALRLSTDIALDPKIISMVNIAGQYEARQYYDFIGLKKGFLSYQAANSFIEEIYIYFRNNQLILSGSGTYDPEMFFHKTYGNNLEFEAWQDFMGDMHRREFVQMHEIGTGTIDKKFIVLAQSLPLEYAGGSNATLIIHLADSVFKESIQKTRWLDQGTIQIVNNSNDLLYTTSKDGGTEPTVRYDAISGTEGNLKLKNVSEDVIVSYIQSGIADWFYLSITPEKIFMKKASAIRQLSFSSLLASLVLGMLLTFVFTKKNYHPIQRLIGEIASKSGLQQDKQINEYRFIGEALQQIIAEKKSAEDLWKRQLGSLRDNYIARLVRGDFDPRSMDSALSLYDIRFISDQFAVMLFYIEDTGSVFPYSDTQEGWRNLDTVRFIIKNVVEELVGRQYPGYVFLMDEFMVCLVNVRTQGDSDIGKQLTDISREAKDFIEHNFKIALSISISCVHEKAEGIKTAYQEAMKGIEYKILFGSGGIIPYDSIRHTDSGYHMGGKSLALQQEQLANCIKARSYKEAKAIINEIIDSHITGAYPPIDLLKIRMFGLLNDIITAFEDSIPYIAEDFAKEINIYERMINCRTLPELREETNKIFDEMDTYLQDRQRSDAEELIHQIKQRVYTDFHDPNLCVSTIASHFSLNVSYLSRFYKEQTGEGLLEYIQKFRTEKAKGMLDGSLNIKEISKKVGYENPDTFIRLFKKHEGITPGRYRRIRQE